MIRFTSRPDLLVRAACLLLAACASPPPPSLAPAVDNPGGLHTRTLFESRPIFDVLATGGGILVVMGGGATRIDRAGRVLDEVRFPAASYFPVKAWNGRFLAHDNDGRRIVVLGSDGAKQAEIPASYAADFAAGELVAVDRTRERQLAFYDAGGALRQVTPMAHYLSTIRARGAGFIAGTYPNEERGMSLYEIIPGRPPILLHKLQPVADIDLLPGGEEYAAVAHDAIELRSLTTGAVRLRLAAPDAHRFANIHVLALPGEQLVVLLDGSGYLPRHALLWYDAGRLVYREIGDGHAHALAPDGCAALVAKEARLVRLTPRGCT